ncbi:hypothetical protein Q9966_005641 [Columba livia]|nr:hypothetical protein Q9966_005641 [Columba livia]
MNAGAVLDRGWNVQPGADRVVWRLLQVAAVHISGGRNPVQNLSSSPNLPSSIFPQLAGPGWSSGFCLRVAVCSCPSLCWQKPGGLIVLEISLLKRNYSGPASPRLHCAMARR